MWDERWALNRMPGAGSTHSRGKHLQPTSTGETASSKDVKGGVGRLQHLLILFSSRGHGG